MLILMLVLGLMMLIHALPLGPHFFDKLVTLDKFVHGDYTKEVFVWENRTNDLRKQLDKAQEDVKLLRSEKSSEESSAYQLERKVKDDKEKMEHLDKTVKQLQQKVSSLEQDLKKSQTRENVSKDKLEAMKS